MKGLQKLALVACFVGGVLALGAGVVFAQADDATPTQEAATATEEAATATEEQAAPTEPAPDSEEPAPTDEPADQDGSQEDGRESKCDHAPTQGSGASESALRF